MLLLPSSVSFGSEILVTCIFIHMDIILSLPVVFPLACSFSFCTAVWVIPIDLSSNSLILSLAVFVESSDVPAQDTLHLCNIYFYF